jgi:hypothetical protein
MSRKRFLVFGPLLSLFLNAAHSQSLQPGFDKEEYIQMMFISTRSTADSTYYNQFPEPYNFTMAYQSPTIGLDNLWQLWLNPEDKVAAVSLRGTTENPESWLENFYAAMVPAHGEVWLDNAQRFSYRLSENPQAAVHVGWLLGMAMLSYDILPRIEELCQQDFRDIIVVGHSQGGALAYLLTAHLYNLRKRGLLPFDLRIKTYCSAAPKPGNLYFAHEYEAMTQEGWAYNVVNAADWVPETPISIQTLDDFNPTNPFLHAKSIFKQQKFPRDVALRYVYNQLNKPTRKARKNYQKYLGRQTEKMVVKQIPGLKIPAYYPSNHYVRTGSIIVLLPDEGYREAFPEDPGKIFNHHFHRPYLYLAEKL